MEEKNETTSGVTPDPKVIARAKEFEALARPLMKWLNTDRHPHHTILITPTHAELLEGVCATGTIMDYVKD